MPERLAQPTGGGDMVPLPLESDPLFVSVARNPRTDHAQAQRWLRMVGRRAMAA